MQQTIIFLFQQQPKEQLLQASDVAVTPVAVGCDEDKAEQLYLLQTKLLSSLKANEINTFIFFINHSGLRSSYS